MHQNFCGQEFHIGIDVHKKNWVVTLRSDKMELRTFSIDPSPEALHSHMQRNYPGGKYISAYEAGFSGFWIHRRLESLAFKNLVIHAADLPSTNKERSSKTDKVDSRKIARELENKSLKGIYVPDELRQQLRSLCRLRGQCVRNQTRVKNRIKGHLYMYGIVIPSQEEMPHWSANFINWLRSLEFSQSCGKDYLLFCLEELQQHRKRTVDVTRILRSHLKSFSMYEQVKLLRSIPGIGPIVALSFFTEIMDINRFATFDHLASFVGLVPSLRDSGDKSTEQGLTQRRNRYLRHLIVEAAWVAIRKDPALLLAFNQLSRRMKKQDAIIRIAKKLLRRIRYVWKNQTPYVMAIVE
jgi:transposase